MNRAALPIRLIRRVPASSAPAPNLDNRPAPASRPPEATLAPANLLRPVSKQSSLEKISEAKGNGSNPFLRDDSLRSFELCPSSLRCRPFLSPLAQPLDTLE